MKATLRKFPDQRTALGEIASIIRDQNLILRGKPIPEFGNARPREVVANWMIVAVLNFRAGGERWAFASPDEALGGDGVIYDTHNGENTITEHVVAAPARADEKTATHERIRELVLAKQTKGGRSYAKGKTLVIYNAIGNNDQWHPSRVAEILPENDFSEVWVVGLQRLSEGRYTYYVALLGNGIRNAPIWTVAINEDFTAWEVTQIQFE